MFYGFVFLPAFRETEESLPSEEGSKDLDLAAPAVLLLSSGNIDKIILLNGERTY